MQIGPTPFSNLASIGFRFTGVSAQQGASSAPRTGRDFREFGRLVLEFQEAHREVQRAGRYKHVNGVKKRASSGSLSGIGISTTQTATTLRSTEEVNTIPTSYSTVAPTFQGSSSSDPTISGTYSGANGDTTLTFTAIQGGLVGLTTVRLEVTDSEGSVVDTVSIGFGQTGDAIALNNGLSVSLSGGVVSLGDSFELDVSATVGTSVNPDAAFDGTGDARPKFDAGESVGAGSFEVNGVTISVLASDTLSAVLDKINASAAGVTALYDAASDSVVLTQDTLGPGADVVVGNDTSGFLSATKLDGATSVAGESNELLDAIADVAELAGIQSGSFTINGITLTVDVLTDSLQDVIDRINAADTGATATFDVRTGRVLLSSDSSSSPLVLSDVDSGLFDALHVDEGTFQGRNQRGRTKFRDESALRRGLGKLAQAYTALLEGDYVGYGSTSVKSIRAGLVAKVEGVFEDVLGKTGTGTLHSDLGLDLVARDEGPRGLELASGKLGRALRKEGDELAEFLFEDDGLIAELEGQLEKALAIVDRLVGGSGLAGLRVDVSG